MSTACRYLQKKVSLFQAVDCFAVPFYISKLPTVLRVSVMRDVMAVGFLAVCLTAD